MGSFFHPTLLLAAGGTSRRVLVLALGPAFTLRHELDAPVEARADAEILLSGEEGRQVTPV